MVPVIQTKIFNGTVGSGNCLAAAIASILHFDIEQLPRFEDTVFHWRKVVNEWLTPLDLYILPLPYEIYKDYVKGYHLIVGKTGQNFVYKGETLALTHCVVGYNGDVAHNPTPAHFGGQFVPFSIELFVKRNELCN